MGRKKNAEQPRMIREELLRFYTIERYNTKTGETVLVDEIPDGHSEIFDYEYKENDIIGYDGIEDVSKFIEIYNSITNRDKYDRIYFECEGEGDCYPCPHFVGVRYETADEMTERIKRVEREKIKKEKQKEQKRKEKEAKALENKKKQFEKLKKELENV